MDLTQKMDADLVAVYQQIPEEGIINWEDLPGTRKMLAGLFEQVTADVPDSENVTKEDRRVPGPEEGAPEVPVRVYRPAENSGTLPGILWSHGGGYVIGSVEEDDFLCQHIAETVGCVVVSVGYRLAPEHPFPAPLEDCYAALKWMAGNAIELGIDPARIAIAGASSGGGLTAGLALLARDRGEVSVAFQTLVYPMIDDRNETPSSHSNAASRAWSRAYTEKERLASLRRRECRGRKYLSLRGCHQGRRPLRFAPGLRRRRHARHLLGRGRRIRQEARGSGGADGAARLPGALPRLRRLRGYRRQLPEVHRRQELGPQEGVASQAPAPSRLRQTSDPSGDPRTD